LPSDPLLIHGGCAIAVPMDDLDDDELTNDHMRVLQWLDVHPMGTSAIEIVHALNLDCAHVEALCADLVAAEMVQGMQLQ
jgi:hypothetical protein